MSTKRECDCCGAQAYTDSRSPKDAMAFLEIYQAKDFYRYHLCKKCFAKFMKDYFKQDLE